MPKLKKSLSSFDAFIMALTATVSSALYVLPGTLIGLAGPAIILVFIIMGIFDILNSFCYAELGAAFPEAGGSYSFVQRAKGGFWGFIVGWMLWLGNSALIAFFANGFARALNYFIPNLWIVIVSMLAILAFTFVNLRGVREASTSENIITYIQMLTLFIFAASLTPLFNISNFDPFMSDAGVFGVIQAMGLVIVMYVGNEFVCSASEEMKDPRRTFPG